MLEKVADSVREGVSSTLGIEISRQSMFGQKVT
jgi:hypothetical protein